MAAHSYHYHHRGFPRFGRVYWNPRWWSVEMIPVCYRWGCRTFQTASHIHVIHILGVWTHETVVDGHMAAHSHHYYHRGFPRFGEFTEILDDVNVEMIPLRYCWGFRTFLNCIPHSCHTYIRSFKTWNSCGWAYGSTLIPLPPQRFPQIWENLLKS